MPTNTRIAQEGGESVEEDKREKVRQAFEELIRQAVWMGDGVAPAQAAPQPALSSETVLAATSGNGSEPPPPPSVDVPAKIEGEDVVIWFADRRYRVRGLEKNMSAGQLRVNLLASRGNDFYGDTLDLCCGHPKAVFSKLAGVELGVEERVIIRDLGQVWLKLEQMQSEQIARALEPKQQAIELSEEEKTEAMAFLRSPLLLEELKESFRKSGIVGEENNSLTAYLAAVSRKLERPLAILIQSSSAAGKSSLMEAVLAFMPEEEQVKYSAMTGQALFYMEGADLKHKILAIAEEVGAQKASYALKLLQSEGVLTIASTGKDPQTGRLVTHEYRVEGPVMIFSTTTAIEIDEELLNRCVVLTVDEGREQTRAIHRLQREMQTLKGLWAKEERKHLRRLQRNAQRLLRPMEVVNPYAQELTFLDDKTRTRRDHEKYLTLILSVTLLHQYQREPKKAHKFGVEKEYIETQMEDIEVANKLASEVLGRSLDELPPQTRRFLMLIDEMVSDECERQKIERSEYRFSRREVRRHTAWSYQQVRVHMERLVEMEYLLVHRGGRGQSFVYELLYDGKGKDGEPFLIGLIEVDKLRKENL
jgi:hypothetical protein